LLLEQHAGEKRFRDCTMAAMLAQQRFYELFRNSPDRASSVTPSPSPSGKGWWRWREVTGGRRRTTNGRPKSDGGRMSSMDERSSTLEGLGKRIWTR
jgi:hypothetical protein